MFLNKAFIIGNLTRDPEIRSLPSGMKVATFSLATNRVWKDQNGEKKEAADFHNIVVFGRQAEVVAQYLKKGASAFVEGRMQTRSWDAPDGQKRYRTEVVADRVQFGPKSAGATATAGATGEAAAAEVSDDKIDYPDEQINTEDIPF
jgi:single-strand DNA-binding protein